MDTLGGTLTIKETKIVNAGYYTCVAVNPAGSSSGKVSLDVGGGSLVIIRLLINGLLFILQWEKNKCFNTF